jgi:glycosyltransferase involved in cell wall biosynthesis
MQVYHFHNAGGGGVLSVIKNLIRFSGNPLIENHVIHAVNRKEIPEYKIETIEGAVTQQLFYYDPKNNFYYICKHLAKLLPDAKAIIVAHDWLELGMASNLGLQNPVVQYLHGDYDYYYQLAIKNKASIDLFIAVSENIQLMLQKKIAERANDILYLRFPVPESLLTNNKIRTEKNIIFIGRLTLEKGYYLLPEIARKINSSSTKFRWHIVGTNLENKEKNEIWDKDIDVQFYGNIENDKVQNLLTEMDFFILPSIAEGMPVSLIEAMKAGVVPLVNNLRGGIEELIENAVTGFKIENNNIEDYTSKLMWLVENEKEFQIIKIASKKKADCLFNPQKNTAVFEKEIVKLKITRSKKAIKKYGSRLDQKWISNKIVFTLRNIGR